jgi:hypothetical protein
MTADNCDDDTGTAIDLPPEPPAEAFRVIADLISLIQNSSVCEQRLISLRLKHRQIRSAQKKLDADRAAHSEQISKDCAELEQLRESAGRIWKIAKAAESAMATREQAVRTKEHELGLDFVPPGDFRPIEGTTITQSPEPRPRPRTVRHDPQGNAFAPGSTITMSVPGGELPPLIEGSAAPPDVPMQSARRPGRPRKSSAPPKPSASEG